MSTTTTNLALVKPDLTDSADITAMNPNWDKLDTEITRKLGVDGGVLNGALQFDNKDIYRAIGKTRTYNGKDYYVNFGCGIVGGYGCISMEIWNNSEEGDRLGRLEIGQHGVSYIDPSGSRTYLYRNTAVSASVES